MTLIITIIPLASPVKLLEDDNHIPDICSNRFYFDRDHNTENKSLDHSESTTFDILLGGKCGPEKGRWGER